MLHAANCPLRVRPHSHKHSKLNTEHANARTRARTHMLTSELCRAVSECRFDRGTTSSSTTTCKCGRTTLLYTGTGSHLRRD